MRRLVKWLVRLGIVLGLLAVAAGCWLANYDARDWVVWFQQNKGTLVEAQQINSMPKGEAMVHEMEFANDRGLRVRGRVSMPDPERHPGNPRWPAVVLVVGVETGRKVIDLLPPQHNLIVLALDYPGDPRFDFNGLVPAVRTATRFRQACVDMIPAVLLASDWLHRQPVVRYDHVSLVGVSVGAMVAAAAGAADERFDQVVLVQGGAGIGRIVAHNAPRLGLPLSPESVVSMAEWMFKPLEPARYVSRIAPRPLTLLGAKQDEFVPPAATEALFNRARDPKKMIWLEGAHASPDERTVIAEVSRRVLTEMASVQPLQRARKTIDSMGR